MLIRIRVLHPEDRGQLAHMLQAAYAPLLRNPLWQAEAQKWDDFDTLVFDNLDTVGRAVFISEVDGKPIGFMSHDPRNAPQSVRLGHNCVLPEYQSRGVGTKQLHEAINRLASVETIRVSTGEQPFFEPARRMYAAAGFIEVGRHPGGPDPAYDVIEYELRQV